MGREMNMDLDLGSIPAPASQRLHNLLDDANFFEIPVVNDLMPSPDEYTYMITVIAGNSLHTVHVSDTSMPKALRPLVEELTELAKAATEQ